MAEVNLITPDQLKTLLRSLDERVPLQVGREYFPVAQWAHLAADYIEQLEQVCAQQAAVLKRSCRPL